MADVWPVTMDANRVEFERGGLLEGWIAMGSLEIVSVELADHRAACGPR